MARDIRNSIQRKFKFSVDVKFDGKIDKETRVAAYLFDQNKELIATAPVKDNTATLAFSGSIKGLQLAIGPEFTKEHRDEPPTYAVLKDMEAHFPKWKFELGRDKYVLDPIPGFLLPHWLFCRCRVRGQVIKRTHSEGGVVVDAPVCDARVHICEVDPFPWIIARLPEREIFRLRDNIRDIIDGPWPPIPNPDPGPLRVDPRRLAEVDIRGLRAKNIFGHASGNAVSFNPQPEPPVLGRLDLSTIARRPALPNLRSIRPSIPAKFQVALSAHSATTLRQSLLENLELIRPWFCFWPWIYRWFHRCDELRVLMTDDDGRFDTSIWYPCNGDKPDLYFWVEYSINGVWTTVHRPPKPCNVWWNYVCGTEVTLTITDPRVNGCEGGGDVQGKHVVVKSIGRQVSMGEINRLPVPANPGPSASLAGTVVPGWLHATRESPFGARLEPRVDFGNGLKPAGITHYRWSYQPLGSTDDWIVIDEPIRRHYKTTTAPGDPIVYKSIPISTGSVDDYYAEIDPDLPADGAEWEILDESYDLKSADWDTRLLDNGKYELKLELFKGAGGAPVDFDAESVGLSEIEDPAPLIEGSYTTSLAEHDRVITTGGNIMGYRLVLHVDNDHCNGTIESVTVAPGNNDTRCGFLEYGLNATATISFRASHPANYARFDYDTVRVATDLPSASAAGLVDDVSVVDDASSPDVFVRAGDLFSKSVLVTDLLSEGADEPFCVRAAFAQELHVYSLATNGYRQLHELDAPRAELGEIDLRGFAVTPLE